MLESDKKELEQIARKVRRNIIKMIHNAKSGHPGGSLSGVDILLVLYKYFLNIPKDWDKSSEFENRDRFILSKGHASPLLYSILSEQGFLSEEDLLTFRKFGSKLQGHPAKGYVPGVETSTGSLGAKPLSTHSNSLPQILTRPSFTIIPSIMLLSPIKSATKAF